MGYRKNTVSVVGLLRLAQKRFLGHQANLGTTSAEAQQLFEELEIHQIELELQNEHLNAARVQLEVALNQSSELYDFAPVGMLSLDQIGTIVKLNLAGATLLGGERAWLLGSKFGLDVAEADRSAFGALFDRAMTSGDVQDCEISLARGLLAMHVQVKIAPLPQAIGCQVVLVDISARKQVEEKLRLSEERWKLALEAAGDGVWDWSVQTGEVVFSARYEQLFGFAENEYGHHVEDGISRIHPEDKPRVMADLQAHLGGRTAHYSNEHRRQCKDGSWKWVLSRGTVVSRTPDGKALRMVGTLVDITGRKQTEEALLLASRFQQAVFDSLTAQIAILDRHGTILQTNAA